MIKKTILTLSLALGVTLAAHAQNDAPKGSRLANSIAAIAEGKIITVEEVRRELQPYLPQIQAASEGDPLKFRQLIEQREKAIIQRLTDNVLLVKQFYEDKGQIPPSFVNNEIEETIITRFNGKRSQYLEYLKSIGLTAAEHGEKVREEIIVNFMRGKMRKSASVVSPFKIEEFYKEYKEEFFQEEAIYMRLIRLTRKKDEDVSAIQEIAAKITEKLELGFSFDELAAKYSNDSKAARGGDWGWITRKSLIEALSGPAFELRADEYTDPILIGDNLFILYAEDYRPEGYLPLSEVRESIEDILVTQMATEAETKYLERLRRDGYVKTFN